MKQIYLDNAATTRVRDEVIEKMQSALANCYGNPSSTHGFGRTAKTAIETARKTIAKYLNAQPSEIIFTSGGTEADNMILRCAVRDLGVDTIITSRLEHHAVLHTVEELEAQAGVKVCYLDLEADGNPDMDHLRTLLESEKGKKLVSLMHINNEIGNKIDMEAVSALCKEQGAYLHSDTVQSIGHYTWDVQAIPIDFMTAAAHKFHGPKGVGFAYIRKNSGMKPMIVGGAQERGYRAGTEPFHNIVGLEEAFVLAYDHLEEERQYVSSLKKYFIDSILKAFPEAKFNGLSGDMEKSTYTLVNVRLPISQEKALMLLFHLDIKGIACSKGSACQSGSDSGSHVLSQILTEKELKNPSLRFSFSIYNTKDEIDYTVKVLKEFSKDEKAPMIS
ncbi:cysteine desulfurase [Muriicola jejuensis]|uniref:cysteine desulfurase n=1 Tax=Muriicola jejuensis TaxID=504488 RepID=A0A6P0U6X7_9FLAO|nr:cysteine desulfurase family protein [Muriicola jejuensis]NER09031.1 aminotransferase class V-fold PLP-dependent enzyme [Muriicola jejuensis]SMP11977.1 cysteine desulfurase [Muriicola jejuensis]